MRQSLQTVPADSMPAGVALRPSTRHNTVQEQQPQHKTSGSTGKSCLDEGDEPRMADEDSDMVDATDSGDEPSSKRAGYETADSDAEGQDSEQEQDVETPAAAATVEYHDAVISNSEEEGVDDNGSGVTVGMQQQIPASISEGDAADVSSGGEAESSASSDEEEEEDEDEIQPFQSTRACSSSGRKPISTSTATAAAATTFKSRAGASNQPPPAAQAVTPRRGRSTAAAATPRRTRSAAAAVTPRSTRSTTTAAATPTSRPVRSCRSKPIVQQQPSLATPLAKLSLSHQTPKSKASKPPAAAAAATPSNKAATGSKKRSTKGSSSSGPAVGDVLPHVLIHDETFMRGDDVYLMQDEYIAVSDDEDEACEVCGSSSMKRGNPILECSTCLRGFHLKCHKPALKKVPDGDWFCSDCNAGHQPDPPSRLITHWQKVLYGKNELSLVHILGCQRGKAPNGTEEDQILVRYYMLPQDTCVGRQKHHGAREVFLGTQPYVEPAHAIVGRAYVHSPSNFAEAGDEEGNDVYLCEFEYDESWKRFKKRRYHGGCDAEADGGINAVTPGTHWQHHDTLGAAMAGVSGWCSPQRGCAGDAADSRFDESGGAGSSTDDDSQDSEADELYKPELRFARTPGTIKRKRHGQLLPAEAQAAAAVSDKFAGLGASDIGFQRHEQRDAFGRLHASLSLAAVPSSLPCRDEERTRLKGFMTRAVREDGGVLYICGVPGTGKTALVMEVLASMRDQAVKCGAQFVAINCLLLPSPQHVFSRLWEKMSGQHLGPARARDALMGLFGIVGGSNSRRKYSTIIVLDEIDMLMTKDQAVLYQLFDWPNQPGSRLGIIGISNTHDLDQRVLPRIASRLDQAKLVFAPYSVAQLQEIVKGRLDASGAAGAVEDSAVQLACRKVASEIGDVRRALEMLRRAVEIGRQQKSAACAAVGSSAASRHSNAQQQQPKQPSMFEWKQGQPPLVTKANLMAAQKEMFGALHLQLLRSRSQWEKVMLVAVVVEARATGQNAVVIQNVCERAANSIASLVNLQAPSLGVLQHVLVKLASMRLLLSDGAHIKAHVALNVDKDDIALAVKEDVRLIRLHQLL